MLDSGGGGSGAAVVALNPTAVLGLARRCDGAGADLERRWRDLRATLDSIGASAGAVADLASAARWARAQGRPLRDRAAALVEDYQDGFFSGLLLDRFGTRYASPADARAAAVRLAERFLKNAGEPEELEQIARLLLLDVNDPTFAHAFYDRIGFGRAPVLSAVLEAHAYAYDYDGNIADEILRPFSLVLATASRSAAWSAGHTDALLRHPDPWNVGTLFRYGQFGRSLLLGAGERLVLDDLREGGFTHRPAWPLGEDDWRGYTDGRVAIVEAMSRRPEVAAELLVRSEDAAPLLLDAGLGDAGWAVGSLVEQACVALRATDPKAADAATQVVVRAVGEQDHFAFGVQSAVATVTADRIQDLVYAGRSTDQGLLAGGVGDPSRPGIEIDAELARKLLKVSFEFGDTGATVLAAAESYVANEVRAGARSGELDLATQRVGVLTGMLVDVRAGVVIGDAAEADADAAAVVGMLDAAIALVPVPGGKLVGLGVDQLKSAGLSLLERNQEAGARVDAETFRTEAHAKLRTLIAASHYEAARVHGSDELVASALELNRSLPDEQQFLTAAGAIKSSLTEPQRYAFNRWITDDGALNEMIADDVTRASGHLEQQLNRWQPSGE